MSEKKCFDLSSEIINIWNEYVAAIDCRDQVLKNSIFKFQHKKALYFARIAVQKRQEFWKRINEIYPELNIFNVDYYYDTKKEKICKKHED